MNGDQNSGPHPKYRVTRDPSSTRVRPGTEYVSPAGHITVLCRACGAEHTGIRRSLRVTRGGKKYVYICPTLRKEMKCE